MLTLLRHEVTSRLAEELPAAMIVEVLEDVLRRASVPINSLYPVD